MGLYESLHESIKKSPVIWKGRDYPYFIHAITDGVPRLEPEVLEDVLSGVNEVTDWDEIDLIIGIEAMGLPLVAPTALRMKKTNGGRTEETIWIRRRVRNYTEYWIFRIKVVHQ